VQKQCSNSGENRRNFGYFRHPLAKIHATHQSRTESELFIGAKLVLYFQTLTHAV